MIEYSALEKAVYGVAVPDARGLFVTNGAEMSPRLLRVVQSVIDNTPLSNAEAIAAWRDGMEAEFPEVDWPTDYDVQPSKGTRVTRSILDALRSLSVSQADLDAVETALAGITIPEV